MSEILISAVNENIKEIEKQKGDVNVAEDRAFSYALLYYFYDVKTFGDQDDLVTDGANDGGVDFIYFDDNELKLHVNQAKYVKDLDFNTIIAELDKMYSTIQNFKIGKTGSYNDRVKRALQNALDRLPDDNPDNYVLNVYTSANVDVEQALKKISNTTHNFPIDIVSIIAIDDIENQIQDIQEKLDIVESYSLKIDRPKNYLQYENETARGVMVNLQASSLIKLYNNYSSKGLFDLNIRRYIANRMVDSGINETLDKYREDFWFLNNGIIIACEDFDIDGDKIDLYGFSIVNGGQTTTLIGKYKGTNSKDFSIPCKIVCEKTGKKDNHDKSLQFFTRIAEATNSQKPILPRDLKSNSPEMIRLARSLEKDNIYLEIKRGVKNKKTYSYSIKNDELGQLILSMVLQRPGSARSGKKMIFENNELYSRIFKVNYDKNADKKEFLIDLIELYYRYSIIESQLKKSGLSDIQTEVLKNGKQIIFALMGILYMLKNGDIDENDLISDKNIVATNQFTYGKFISNYTGDDIDDKLKRIIVDLVKIATESYDNAYKNKIATSVSNHFKTDKKYIDYVLSHFIDCLGMTVGDDLKAQMDIFSRN